jgi:hypothetical protein
LRGGLHALAARGAAISIDAGEKPWSLRASSGEATAGDNLSRDVLAKGRCSGAVI